MSKFKTLWHYDVDKAADSPRKRAELTKHEGNNYSRINMDRFEALIEKRKLMNFVDGPTPTR